jgi:hypothetical protein
LKPVQSGLLFGRRPLLVHAVSLLESLLNLGLTGGDVSQHLLPLVDLPADTGLLLGQLLQPDVWISAERAVFWLSY